MTSGDGAPGSEIGDVPNQASRAERPARSSRAEIVTAVATILGIPAGFLVLHLTLSDNEQEQFEVAGTQMCIDYRNQVLALHKDGLTTDQIKEFFRGEPGELEALHKRKSDREGDMSLPDDIPYPEKLVAIPCPAVFATAAVQSNVSPRVCRGPSQQLFDCHRRLSLSLKDAPDLNAATAGLVDDRCRKVGPSVTRSAGACRQRPD